MRICLQPSLDDDFLEGPTVTGGLRQLGFDVARFQMSRFFLASIIRQRVRILHFRSLRRYYLGRTRGRTILLSALFAAQIQILRLARIGVIWTVDESPTTERVENVVERWLQGWFARRMDALVVDGPSAERAVQEAFGLAGGTRVAIARKGHYATLYPSHDRIDRVDARKALDLDIDGTIILFLGSIQPRSGLIALISTIRFLRFEDARLVIAGPPRSHDLMDQIRLLIDDDVDLIDVRPMTLTRDDVVAYLKSANVAVIPNQRVSSSSTTMLASTFGVPAPPASERLDPRLRGLVVCVPLRRGRTRCAPRGSVTRNAEPDRARRDG